MRYLTFALTKGRLANKTLDMFEKIGITCEEMRDKDSRKLIFTNEELKLKFFLAKGSDVPTYVELPFWKREENFTKLWIWDSEHAACAYVARKAPEKF